MLKLVNSLICPGNIVERGRCTYIVAKTAHKTFTGKTGYGLLNIDNHVFCELGVSLDILTDVCEKAGLVKIAENYSSYYELINGLDGWETKL